MFIDIVLYVMYAAVGIALIAVIASVSLALRRAGGKSGIVNGIHERRLAAVTAAVTLVLLIASFTFGSTEPLSSAGTTFRSELWLKAADMFLFTVGVLLGVIIIASLCLPPVVRLIDRKARRKAGGDK